MTNIKLFIIMSASLITLASVAFQSINVVENFESPFFYRCMIVTFKIVEWIVEIGTWLNMGKQHAILKSISTYQDNLKIHNDPNINITNTMVHKIPVKIYTPKSNLDHMPAIIYYHGGAFVFGSANSVDPLTFILAKKLNYIVISVDYRLAPEHKYPTPIDDCWIVTRYIMENPNEFKIDVDRIVLVGDSAGGTAVAIVTQKLAMLNLQQPKLQVLIYPWLQQFDFTLPSYKKYTTDRVFSFAGVSLIKMALWYLGEIDVTDEMLNAVTNNEHIQLIEDENIRLQYANYLNADLIPDKYKMGKSYYNNYKKLKDTKLFTSELNDTSILTRNKDFSKLVTNLFNLDVSPALVDDNLLKKLPQAYFAIVEWDELKDEGLIYSERLRLNGVKVDVSYYETGFHGIITVISDAFTSKVAEKMIDDVVAYIKEYL